MSRTPPSPSPDLERLRADGYEVSVRDGYLVVAHIPYVTASRQVKFGILVSKLHLAGETVLKPDTHVIFFQGEYPCHADGTAIAQIRHKSARKDLGGGLLVDHTFSNKPPGGYSDYYEKVTTYVRVISAPATALDPTATAQTFAAVVAEGSKSVFVYGDTNSSRAEINAITNKLTDERIAIVGLGGTGSYLLDAIAKTPVREIHLFDGDKFVQHNAFRAPGAAAIEELRKTPLKAEYLRGIYSRMHTGIHAHPYFMDASSVNELDTMTFVFIAIDKGDDKEAIVDHLEAKGLSFVDVGMDLQQLDGSLRGDVRTSCSTPTSRTTFRERVSFGVPMSAEYDTNIQIAELNMLNAALAVLRWKKLRGFYADQEHELNSTYTIDLNMLVNDGGASAP